MHYNGNYATLGDAVAEPDGLLVQGFLFEVYNSILFVPAAKIAEKAMWRSVFLTKWHRILNADSTKTHSSSVTF